MNALGCPRRPLIPRSAEPDVLVLPKPGAGVAADVTLAALIEDPVGNLWGLVGGAGMIAIGLLMFFAVLGRADASTRGTRLASNPGLHGLVWGLATLGIAMAGLYIAVRCLASLLGFRRVARAIDCGWSALLALVGSTSTFQPLPTERKQRRFVISPRAGAHRRHERPISALDWCG